MLLAFAVLALVRLVVRHARLDGLLDVLTHQLGLPKHAATTRPRSCRIRDPPVTLVPEGGDQTSKGKGGKGGGATTNVVSPRKYTINVSSGWSSVRNAPNSWFIGTAQTGMTLNALTHVP